MDWTQDKVEARKSYLGGSDAAAILGLSRYKTALQVGAMKTGQLIPEDISDRVAVKLGNKLEQTVAELFMEETGKKVHRVNETLFHAQHPFIGANIDRRVVGEDAILECKTTSAYKTREWEGDEIPMEYIVQCVHYLAVTGAERAYIAVLIGNQDFKYKDIKRDERVIAELIAKEAAFWNNFVIPKIMPMQISPNDEGVLAALFPTATPESIIELGDDAQKVAENLDSLQADAKVLEKEIDQQKNTLRAMMKEYETATTKTYKISWSNQKERRLDTDRMKKEAPELYQLWSKEVVKRVLRLKVIKEGNHGKS